MSEKDRIDQLAREIKENTEPRRENPKPTLPQSPLKMALPPGLCEEAAKMIFDFWEMNAARTHRRAPLAWTQLQPIHQTMWVEITHIVIDMAYHILLRDLHRFLDQSNGDMGAAFARALQRYARDILNTQIK